MTTSPSDTKKTIEIMLAFGIENGKAAILQKKLRDLVA